MANQTIINAASAAYTPAKVDISGYLTGLTSIAQGLVQRKQAGIDRTGELNKAYSVFDTTGMDEALVKEITNLRQMGVDASKQMQMSLPFTKKFKEAKNIYDASLFSAQFLKEDVKIFDEFKDKILEDFTAPVGGKTVLSNMSESMSPEIQMYLLNVIEGNFTQDFNRDGVVSEEEKNIKWFKFENGRLNILSMDGTSYMPITAFKNTQFTKADAGEDLSNLLYSFTKKASSDDPTTGELEASINNEYIPRLKSELKKDQNARNSLFFDYEFNTGNGMVSFIDYYFNSTSYRQNMSEGEKPVKIDKTSKIANFIKNNPEIGEYNYGKDGVTLVEMFEEYEEIKNTLSPEVQRQFKFLLAQAIIENDSDINDDFLDFAKEVMTFSYKKIK
tara:strand:+ start:3000 stop:4166 length:1167 start_codon:yes stop_codon:yes gene_type:complete